MTSHCLSAELIKSPASEALSVPTTFYGVGSRSVACCKNKVFSCSSQPAAGLVCYDPNPPNSYNNGMTVIRATRFFLIADDVSLTGGNSFLGQ